MCKSIQEPFFIQLYILVDEFLLSSDSDVEWLGRRLEHFCLLVDRESCNPIFQPFWTFLHARCGSLARLCFFVCVYTPAVNSLDVCDAFYLVFCVCWLLLSPSTKSTNVHGLPVILNWPFFFCCKSFFGLFFYV